MRFSGFCLLSVACVAGLGVAVVGCSSQTGPSQEASRDQTPSADAPPKPPVLKPAETAVDGDQSEPKGVTHQKEKKSVAEKARVGVGKKGRRLEDERLVRTIVTPAVSLFRTRERMVFEVQIPKAMKLYEASHGEPPETEEAFFEHIIKANRINLPTLPAGQRYVYDPEKGQLMVERPAR